MAATSPSRFRCVYSAGLFAVDRRPGHDGLARHVFGNGDRLAIRFTMTGTHRDHFLGVAPTGRSIAVDGITILRFSGGKCIERWSRVDRYGWLAQLGVVSPLG